MSNPDTVPYEIYQALKIEYDQFNYIISHDLSAPLRHIEQFSALLVENLAEHIGEEEKVFSTFISQSVQRSQSMLDALLELSRITTEDDLFGHINIDALLDTVIEKFPKAIIDCDIKRLSSVYCDHHLMTKLFTLLIENAIKFKHSDRTLRISIAGDVISHDQCFIKVSDNGIGIASNRETIIFEPFQRLHPSEEYSGTGMGLTYCRKIVNLHSGSITCTAIENGGSLFTIVLPIGDQSLVAA